MRVGSKPRDSSNLVVFAVKNERSYPQWSRLMSKAQTLDKRYRLDLLWVVKKQATARGARRLINYSSIRTFRHAALFYSEKTFPETG